MTGCGVIHMKEKASALIRVEPRIIRLYVLERIVRFCLPGNDAFLNRQKRSAKGERSHEEKMSANATVLGVQSRTSFSIMC